MTIANTCTLCGSGAPIVMSLAGTKLTLERDGTLGSSLPFNVCKYCAAGVPRPPVGKGSRRQRAKARR